MGIEVWLAKAAVGEGAQGVTLEHEAITENTSPYAQLNWETLKRIPTDETGCVIAENCKRYDPTNKSQQADWLLLIDAPVKKATIAHETELILTDMLSAIGLDRAQIFMTCVLDYAQAEIEVATNKLPNYIGFLTRQIELLQPKIILVLGTVAAKQLLQTQATIAELRGFKHNFASIATVVTYHPADLLHSNLDKRLAWQDLQLAMSMFNPKTSRGD